MNAICLSTLLFIAAAPRAERAAGAEGVAGEPGVRTLVRQALADARGVNLPPEAAIRALLEAHDALLEDESLRATDRARLLRTVRVRLAWIGEALGDMPRQPTSGVGAADTKIAARVELPPEQSSVLAQQGAVFVGQGGGARLPAVGGRNAGRAAPDHGPDLAELIRRTIAPTTWDVNGGEGSIVYYRPLRVLVVRQTGGVHGQLRGFVGQLRGN